MSHRDPLCIIHTSLSICGDPICIIHTTSQLICGDLDRKIIGIYTSKSSDFIYPFALKNGFNLQARRIKICSRTTLIT